MRASSVGVYFPAPGFEDYPFDDSEYVRSYHEFGERVARKGGQFTIVRGKESFLGEGRFTHGWRYGGETFHPINAPVTLDIVLNKDRWFIFDDRTHVVNERALHLLCMKDRTYTFFPDCSPRTVVVQRAEELPAALDAIPSERIVVKPPEGQCGEGVHIGGRSEVTLMSLRFPVIVQEFLDTSHGIEGFVDGIHDFRMVFVGGEVAASWVRTPPPGKLLANVAQGGTMTIVSPECIPADALSLAHRIDARLRHFPERWYSVDIGRCADGAWRLIELNSPPALLSLAWGMERYHELLADHLLAAARGEL